MLYDQKWIRSVKTTNISCTFMSCDFVSWIFMSVIFGATVYYDDSLYCIRVFTAIRSKTSCYSMALEPARQPGHVTFVPYVPGNPRNANVNVIVYWNGTQTAIITSHVTFRGCLGAYLQQINKRRVAGRRLKNMLVCRHLIAEMRRRVVPPTNSRRIRFGPRIYGAPGRGCDPNVIHASTDRCRPACHQWRNYVVGVRR